MASTNEEERWQTKKNTISERNKYMFNNPLLSDIKFAFPNTDTVIPAHKYVLAVSSPVFFAMFYSDLAETKDTIDITDCDPDIFLRFLLFLYCDEANFGDADCAIKVWHLADKYDVPSLAKESVKYLDGDMDPQGAFDVLTYARQLSDRSLEEACWEVIDYNAEGIVHGSFLNIKHELLVSFLQRPSLRIEEATLFSAVDRWAAKRCEEAGMTVDGANKRHVLGEDLLKNFRLPLMSPTQFSDVVLPKEILTTDEVIDVFKSFSKVPIPGGLKFSVHPRVTSINTPVLFVPTTNFFSSVQKEAFYGELKLTFEASRNALLCGLGFLFADCDSALHRLRLTVSQRGEKIKELSATCRGYQGCSTTPGLPSFLWHDRATKVFFNRPFYVTAKICYTIEVIEASSRSRTFLASNSKNYAYERFKENSGTPQNKITFRYCGGYHSDEISQTHQYQGDISALLYTAAPY